jgi:hypothetical protein
LIARRITAKTTDGRDAATGRIGATTSAEPERPPRTQTPAAAATLAAA